MHSAIFIQPTALLALTYNMLLQCRFFERFLAEVTRRENVHFRLVTFHLAARNRFLTLATQHDVALAMHLVHREVRARDVALATSATNKLAHQDYSYLL